MNKDIIIQKLDLITAELIKMHNLRNLSLKEYLEDFTKSYTGERIIEKIVGAAIDINNHIIAINNEKVPNTYYDSFIMLAKLGIYSLEFAKKIALSAKLRNKIIHEYEEIEDEQIYESFSEAIEQYKDYVQYIQKFLEKQTQ